MRKLICRMTKKWWNMDTLKILTVQSKLFWESPNENRAHLGEWVASSAEDCDIVVLPEMFTTGFSMQPELYAEAMADDMDSLVWMRQIASHGNTAVTGTLAVSDGGDYFNRIFWVFPDGKYCTADKRHLFTLGEEHKHYTAGKHRLVVEWRGWKINPMCCYDLRFPVWCRNKLSKGVAEFDVQIFMANWPDKRIAHWDKLLPARAIENQAVVVGVNIVGEDANQMEHSGHSAVYNALGETMGCHPPRQEGIMLHEISREDLEKTRRSLAFLKDGDGFTIQ